MTMMLLTMTMISLMTVLTKPIHDDDDDANGADNNGGNNAE